MSFVEGSRARADTPSHTAARILTSRLARNLPQARTGTLARIEDYDSANHWTIRPSDDSAIESFNDTAIEPANQPAIRLSNESANDLTIQLSIQPTIRPSSHSANDTWNHSTIHSSIHPTNHLPNRWGNRWGDGFPFHLGNRSTWHSVD